MVLPYLQCSLLPFDLDKFPTLNMTLVGIYHGKQDGTQQIISSSH